MEQHILTEEDRKSLEGLTPFNATSTVRYTPASYQGVKESLRPIFELRPLRKLEADRILRTLAGGVKFEKDESYLREQVRQVIMNIENLYDSATGQPIEYHGTADGMDRDLYSTLPIHITTDILMYVSRISGLIPPERLGLTS